MPPRNRNRSSFTQVIQDLRALDWKAEKVVQRMMSDAKKRAPGWAADEIRKVYNIKRKELMPATVGRDVGRIKVKTNDADRSMSITYQGRRLTPTHFGMTPRAPRNTYTLKAEILKGQKKVLGQKKKLTKKQRAALGKNFRRQGTQTSDHSPIMLMHTGNAREGGIDYIPFQRKSTRRSDIQAIKTVSLPQMASSERTQDNILKAINEGMEKRLAQHMKILEN